MLENEHVLTLKMELYENAAILQSKLESKFDKNSKIVSKIEINLAQLH